MSVRARRGFQRELGDERFARAGGQHHDAAPSGGFPRGERLGLVRVRGVAGGEVEGQVRERAGAVLDGGAFGGERFDQRAVTVGGDAETFHAVVPFGVVHPGPAARRRVQQQRAAVVGEDGGAGHGKAEGRRWKEKQLLKISVILSRASPRAQSKDLGAGYNRSLSWCA